MTGDATGCAFDDQDPDDNRRVPSNRDSNPCIISGRHTTCQTLPDAMKEIPFRTHGLIRYFEGGPYPRL